MRVAAYLPGETQPAHFLSSRLAAQLSLLIVKQRPAVSLIQFERRADGSSRILSVTLSGVESFVELKRRFQVSKITAKMVRVKGTPPGNLNLGYPHKQHIQRGWGIARKGCVAISDASLLDS